MPLDNLLQCNVKIFYVNSLRKFFHWLEFYLIASWYISWQTNISHPVLAIIPKSWRLSIPVWMNWNSDEILWKKCPNVILLRLISIKGFLIERPFSKVWLKIRFHAQECCWNNLKRKNFKFKTRSHMAHILVPILNCILSFKMNRVFPFISFLYTIAFFCVVSKNFKCTMSFCSRTIYSLDIYEKMLGTEFLHSNRTRIKYQISKINYHFVRSVHFWTVIVSRVRCVWGLNAPKCAN